MGQNITYTWTANGGSTSWSNAQNWSPTRTTPAPTDILIFDPATVANPTPTSVQVDVDFNASETVAQLRFLNGVVALLTTSSTHTLTVAGGLPGPDFELSGTNAAGAPTTVRFNGPAALQLALPASSQGSVTAALTFVNALHSITATGSESLVFGAGGLFTAGVGFGGNAFGVTGTINSVIFRSGSTYTQLDGASPFGNSSSSITRFDSGSRFIARTSPIAFSNRTYGTLELAANLTNTGGGTLNVLNNLEITSGTVSLGGLSTLNIGGNFTVNGGTATFNGSTTSVVRFNGTSAQIINGTGGNNPIFEGILEISNPTGMTLARPVRANGGLLLTNGLIRTTATNVLTLGPSATLNSGSNASFVEGPLAREVATAASVSFPIGRGSVYRPLTLNIISAPPGTTTYTAVQNEGAATDQVLLGDIRSISRTRYFTLTPDPVPAPNAFTGTVELSFGTNEGILNPGQPSLVVAKNNGSGWNNIGRSRNTVNSLTSGAFESFGDFVLASTDPTANPLPVTLISFAAQQVMNGIQLRWTTASEQNNVRFEVQRSATGAAFVQVATLAGQGQSSRSQQYVVLDQHPPAGQQYYRLRQVDVDGTATFSPVVLVVPQKEVTVYPNPARTELHLAAPAAATYQVRDSRGKVVIEGATSNGTVTLAVENLPTGLYQLRVASSSGYTMRKFIKVE